MARKTASDWQNEANLNLGNDILSDVSTGMSIGSAFGAVGAAAGAMIGGAISLGKNLFFGNKKEVNQYINNAKTIRKDNTIERNKSILDIQNQIKKTRSDFDTIYGAGLFDQYDSMFMKILDLQPSDSLNSLLSNMQLDKVSGEITSRLNGKAGTTLLTSALSITDINDEYLEYLKEQLRAQDTAFGLEMQDLATRDTVAIKQYYDDMGALRLQYAQQFENAFMQTRMDNIEAETALADASVSQAVSGIKQEGSGLNQSNMIAFQNDIAKVARASATKYQMSMLGYEYNSRTQSFILNAHSIRNSINKGSMSALGSIIENYNKQNQTNKDYYENILDAEKAIDELNQGIKDANDGRTGWFNSRNSDSYYKETMESYFG